MQVGAGQRHKGIAPHTAVAYGGDHHILRDADACLPAVLHGTQSNGVGGAEQAVDAGVAAQQAGGLLVAGRGAELCHHHALGPHRQPGVLHGGFKTCPALLPGRLVQQGDPDVARGMAAPGQHVGRGSLCRAKVVVVHAAATRKLLPQHHQRHMHPLQHGLVLRGVHGGNEQDAVHRVAAQGVQGAEFLLRVVGGVDEQQLVAGFFQHAADALHDAGAAVAGQFGQDDPHLPGAAGAQHLGLYAGVVAGGFHSGLDACPLVDTEVAAVEVAAHRRLGYTGILGKFGDVHEMPPHFSALQGSFGIDLTRGVCYNTALCMTISGKKGKPR